MDTVKFIEVYGIPGAAVLGLAFAVVQLWKAYSDVQNRRIEDTREAAKEIREIAEASNSAIDALTRMLERGAGRG